MAQLVNVRLSRSDAQPWGFRLQGGKDFGTPLVVQKVAGGSIAANAGLVAGDAVIKVNGLDVYNLRHKDAQDAVVRGGNSFEIAVQRGGSTWRPTVSPAGAVPQPVLAGGNVAPVTHTSLAAKPQDVSHIGSGYNSSARPFLPSVNGDGVKSIVNKQYNTPVGMYSDESIAETLSAQAEVLAGGVLGVNFKKNERIYNSANSEVFKMLQEAENDPNDPEESSFSPPPYQSSNQQSSPSGGVTKHVTAPVAQAKPPNTGGLPAGQNICAECERLIVGVFVRIKEKNLHVDCFKCATCGTPLKNQGYFNINNKLYCDIHAKLAALNSPPPGTEGYLPVPIKPNTKLSASTISAALTTHHGSGGGATNGAPQLGSPLSTGSNTNLSCATNFASNSCVLPQALSSCESTPKKLSPMASVGVSPIHSRQNSLGSAMSDTDINHKNVYNILKNCQSDDTPGPRRTYLETDFTDTISECDAADECRRVSDKMQNGTKSAGEFHYKTICGGIIRSVQAPGKGKSIEYKINTNISGPKPFSSAPLSPPSAGPKSPSIYPPPTTAAAWSQPKPPSTFEAPKPVTYVPTLPRANVGPAAPGDLGPECGQTDEISHELASTHFAWPPSQEIDTSTPTATPLYVPPPGTQHMIVKPMLEKQSLSAPELSYGQREVTEMESGSESYTSTSATTTTSEDAAAHMRMYHTQTSQPSYTIYEGADSDGNEVDYAALQHHKQSICSAEVSSFVSETRGAQYLADTLDTTCLVERMRSLTPRPPSPTPMKTGKRVEFSLPTEQTTETQQSSQVQESNLVEVQEQSNFQESTQAQATQFQPIDIPEQKPPSQAGVPNTVPQEWESAMVKALKTAPETPYNIVSVQQEAIEESCVKAEASQSSATTSYQNISLQPLDVLEEKPAEGTIMSSLLATVPTRSVKFEPKTSIEPIPLPEETKPYFPPPIDMTVVADCSIPGRKSEMLEALITAPDRPYSPFGHEVSYQLDDLPRPTEKMTLRSALTVAPQRPFTPVIFDSNGLAHPQTPKEDKTGNSVIKGFQSQECMSSQVSSFQSTCTQESQVCQQVSQQQVCQQSAQQICQQSSQQVCQQTSQQICQQSSQQASRQVCQEAYEEHPPMSDESRSAARRLIEAASPAFEQVSPRQETPSEMLEKSIENLKISDKETFRVKAGEVISGMLQARLDGGKKSMDINQNRVPCTNGHHTDYTKDTPPHSTDDTDRAIDKSNGHENGNESTLNDVVRYRNKPNKNLKPELISHARDRRSYIEKENLGTQESPQDLNTNLNTEDIANNLENGVHPVCCVCDKTIARGPFITALGRIWCPDHFICVNGECRRPLADIGFVEEKGNLYCEYCFEKYIAPSCSKCAAKIKGDCLNAIGKHFHPECFTCAYCGKLFGNTPFFLEEGNPYCEADWNEMFTTKCFACGFPVEAGDRWVEALSHNYHSQCFNCTTCKKNLEGQSFFAKGGRPYCKNHAR